MVVMCLGARAIFYSMHTAEWCGYGVVKDGIVKCNERRVTTIHQEYLFLYQHTFHASFWKNKTDNTATGRLYLLVYHDPSKYREP